MNEPVAKQRRSIDIEEFERYMREATTSPRAGEEDPLAELARLVGHNPDPYGDVFAHQDGRVARELAFGQQSQDRQSQDRQSQDRQSQDPHVQDTHGHAPPFEARPQDFDPSAPPRRPSVDFATIEAGLRGTLAAHSTEARPAFEHAAEVHPKFGSAAYDHAGYDSASYDNAGMDDSGHDPRGVAPTPGAWAAPAKGASRSRRPVYAMAAVIVAGIVGIGVAFAYKGSNSGPREIAMIKAAPGPTKIQPPADDAADKPSSDSSILDKAPQPAPTKTVEHEEQPVDLAQTVQSAPRALPDGISPIYDFNTAGGAAAVPVPSSPDQGRQVMARADATDTAGAKQGGAMGIASDIQPIRVKTHSYRPDGTPIPDDQPPAASLDTPPAASKAEKTPVAKASTPRATGPKTTARVATTPKAVAPKPAAAPKPAEPKTIESAAAGDDAPTDITPAGAQLHKGRQPKPAKPLKVAEAEPTPEGGDTRAAAAPAENASGGGGFAVQLAAPGSEAEAKATTARLEQKFGGAFDGRSLSVHKAVSNGKTVFRVRVVSLSREEATGMCEKLKSSGGSCFVAKN
jgi:hypothetical protein